MELGYQKSLAYAKSGCKCSVTGPKNPDGVADPIIVHPDAPHVADSKGAVRGWQNDRHIGRFVDMIDHSADEDEKKLPAMLFMTPIAKAFLTETGFEAANLALQCFGGHGYIREWGVEQNVRDAVSP